MTDPGYVPRRYSAAEIIENARQRTMLSHPVRSLPQPSRPVLTDADRRALSEAIAAGSLCRCCAGVHAGGELACPRLAVFEVDADGRLKGGSYWPDGAYDTSRIIFAEEATARGGTDGLA